MRVVLLHEFGPPSVLEAADVPEPDVGPGQVLVDVAFASVTFVDTQVRAGRPPSPAMLPTLPAVLGNGVGGIVREVREPSPRTLIGRRIVASLSGTGGYADRSVAEISALVEVPAEVSTRDAVALLADGRTALLLMQAAEVESGDTVLVEAAAGGVGSLLVQLARSVGARVVGAAGGTRKVSVVKELGANVVVDYALAQWQEQARSEVGGVDTVFDGVGGSVGRAAFDLLRPGGRFVAFGMASGTFTQLSEVEAAARSVRLIVPRRPTADESRELVRAALAEAAAGRLRPLVGQTFALDDAAAAHAAIEQRATVGKTLLVTAAST
jgi:NADPH2:quinone reductase